MSKFCSRDCYKKHSWKKAVCLNCKKQFIYKWKGEKAKRKYCSLKCWGNINSPFKKGFIPWNKGKTWIEIANEVR